MTANADTNTFNVFPIAPITLPVGSHFFVGAMLTEIGFQVPASIDLNQRMHNNWVRGWGQGITPDPNNIGATINLDNITVPGSFMIRAQERQQISVRRRRPPACNTASSPVRVAPQ